MPTKIGIRLPPPKRIPQRKLFRSVPDGCDSIRWIGFKDHSIVTRTEAEFWWWSNSSRGLRNIRLFSALILGLTGVEMKIGPAINFQRSKGKRIATFRKYKGKGGFYGIYIRADQRPGYNFFGAPNALERLVK